MTDVFSTNIRQNISPSPKKKTGLEITKPPQGQAALHSKDVGHSQKENVDSGYHGESSDEMDIDEGHRKGHAPTALLNHAHRVLQRESPARRQSTPASSKDDTAIEGSFHSAREDVRDRTESVAPETQEFTKATSQTARPSLKSTSSPVNMRKPEQFEELEKDTVLADPDDSHSSSQVSSPAKTLARKSSLTFATLPAPEPWTTKKSMGVATGIGRGSFLGRVTGGKSIDGSKQQENEPQASKHNDANNEKNQQTNEKPDLDREESENSNIRRMHNKSSTQTLQDKIKSLGQSQGPRPTKSIPSTAAPAVTYPDLQQTEDSRQRAKQTKPTHTQAASNSPNDKEDDSWILPPRQKTEQVSKSSPRTSAITKPATTEAEKSSLEVTQVEVQHTGNEVTPGTVAQEKSADAAEANSYPESKLLSGPTEGPLSASKSKLQSIMKSARGLFSSSAGISAQAKKEASDSPATRTCGKAIEKDKDDSDDAKVMQQISTMTREINNLSNDVDRMAKSRPVSPIKQDEGRRTRSSTEKEQKRKLEQAEHTQVQGLIPEQSPRKVQNAQKLGGVEMQKDLGGGTLQSHSSKTGPVAGAPSQFQRPKAMQRPTKPNKEPVQKPKPAPVNIKIGVPSWRGLPTNNTLSSSLQDSLQQTQPKAAGLAKKPSNASLHTVASNGSIRGAASSVTGKPKALLAAERKKEQDEREAHRKQEAKKEMERKRAAQQEEVRQQEIERHREQERLAIAQESKKTVAGKQAIEKRRLDLKTNQRGPPQDKAPIPRLRPETNDSRPPSRMESSRPGLNQASQNPSRMGIKRLAEQEPEEESRPIRVPAGPAYTANEAKRRRTDDEEDFRETSIRPTMQPPKRVSTAQKVSFSCPNLLRKSTNTTKSHFKPSIFSSSAYTTAPPPAAYHQPHNILKSSTVNPVYPTLPTIQSQPSRPPPTHDISKYATSKPPFAENPNPPAPYKTPNNLPKHMQYSSTAIKTASPTSQYPNGETIHLSDIATDSDSSPDTATKAQKRSLLPSWALSPAINEALERQESQLDADAVFGPVQTPKLEEMFRGGRAGNGSFRPRTSSANWKDSGDCLTREEVRRDREAREELRKRGGWEYGLG